MNQGDEDDFIPEPELDESYAQMGQHYDDKAQQDLDQHVADSIEEYVKIHGGPIPDYYFHKTGDFWLISYEGKRAFVEHLKGMVYLEIILKNNQRKFSLRELCEASGENLVLFTKLKNDEQGESANQFKKAWEDRPVDGMTDEKTKNEVKVKIKKLRAWLEIHENTDNPMEGTYKKELEALEKYLNSSLTKKKKSRHFNTAHERNRKRIKKAFSEAIDRIAIYLPKCGKHLDSEVKTGSTFFYRLQSQKKWCF